MFSHLIPQKVFHTKQYGPNFAFYFMRLFEALPAVENTDLESVRTIMWRTYGHEAKYQEAEEHSLCCSLDIINTSMKSGNM